MSRFLNLRAYLALALALVAVILTMSWCADRARLKTLKVEARQGQAVGKALDAVASQTPVVRREQEEKERAVEQIQGADAPLPAGFGADLERVRRGGERRNP
jgi:hypothetical protein